MKMVDFYFTKTLIKIIKDAFLLFSKVYLVIIFIYKLIRKNHMKNLIISCFFVILHPEKNNNFK